MLCWGGAHGGSIIWGCGVGLEEGHILVDLNVDCVMAVSSLFLAM